MAIDLKFKQDSTGTWDIDFSNGDFELTDSLDTAVYMSIFCEKRASESQVAEPSLRRGHFTNDFNEISEYEVGSLFWLYTQQAKNTSENLTLLENSIIEGLDWLIEDDIISEVNVSAQRVSSKVTLEIELVNKLNKNSKYYNLFINL